MTSERWISPPASPEADALARRYVNLADARLGAEATEVSDEFFAERGRLIDSRPPIFLPDRYDSHGKWMDGWESRRRRGPGHDWCVVRLAARGQVHAIDLDTSFFTGNYPPEAMVEACDLPPGEEPGASTDWRPLLPRSPIAGDRHNLFEIPVDRAVTHVRLHIYPDGGVARLRIFGEFRIDWARLAADAEVEMSSCLNGARAVAWSDAHYGSPANLLLPDEARNMGDGWETARRRGPGNDWAVIALGHPARLTRGAIETRFFKGNYPDRWTLRGARLDHAVAAESAGTESADWDSLVGERPMQADAVQEFAPDSVAIVDRVRLDIFPDGGVSRLRLWGVPA